jgi:4-hydroxy-2-oxoheptanedioate aldolase
MSERHEPLNVLKTLWRDGRTALGAIATIPSVASVQVMARSGLDFILIDMEHGLIDVDIAQAMVAAPAGNLPRK